MQIKIHVCQKRIKTSVALPWNMVFLSFYQDTHFILFEGRMYQVNINENHFDNALQFELAREWHGDTLSVVGRRTSPSIHLDTISKITDSNFINIGKIFCLYVSLFYAFEVALTLFRSYSNFLAFTCGARD